MCAWSSSTVPNGAVPPSCATCIRATACSTPPTTFAFFDGSQWVVTNDGHGTVTLDLIDLQGRVLHSTTLAEGQARIGLPDVAKGMYLMRMTNQNGMFVQKIVVK